jgi:signal peptidase II
MNFLKKFKEIKSNFLNIENFLYASIIIIIFLFDRLSKLKIIKDFNETAFYVNDYINFDLIWNIGIGFGFLSTDSTLLYNFVTMLIGAVITYLVYTFINAHRVDKVIYATIIGGALGNFYDRLMYKAVPDFVDIHYENFHWFTFNVADIFITIGILIYIIRSFFVKD